ncbi:MAG: acetyl-CoA carboxylase biotin carboxylase subunit [Nitrososphaerota archaeon]|nr:acetyl-CoA carboxylase biotin carboxylase subunit [Nitrososphaerota archaeon]MDG6938896.1 acetyl-CoA carboxylase biotin carboxylase subunit [Nitrososphaerota archaeon]
MFSKVLVANRGEIAVRVIRTCKRLGVKTVAVYSDADREALHCGLADEAYRVGGAAPAESYLNAAAIVSLAKKAGAEAVHPGYGFLSENSDFARACEEEGIVFVGPSSATLTAAGNKVECKKLAGSEGVPVIQSTLRPVRSAEEAAEAAEGFGYPVLLKSAFGGGGLGIREVGGPKEIFESWGRAVNEAAGAFGRSSIYVEKLIRPARHVEVQILSDGKGRTIHLGERECSIQRRHQKLVEITPSPAIDGEMRDRIGQYAIKVARAIGYRNSGTVEFLLDAQGGFHFMEVNSRLQVEHPITEAVTGLDLVAEQLSVAAGEGMSLTQDEVRMNGAAIECRINAEDPLAGFAPSAGVVEGLRIPGGNGIRVDTALYRGWAVPEHYDSLVAKLVAWGRGLDEARRRMSVALEEFEISGFSTTVRFHREVMNSEAFAAWRLSTDFLAETGIIEKMVREAAAEKERRMRLGAAVAGILMDMGIHKVLELEDGGRAASRGKHFDAI